MRRISSSFRSSQKSLAAGRGGVVGKFSTAAGSNALNFIANRDTCFRFGPANWTLAYFLPVRHLFYPFLSLVIVISTTKRKIFLPQLLTYRREPAILYSCYGGIAQLVRAPASHAGGHWFESSSLHQENSLEPQGFKEFFCFLVAFSLVFSLTMVFPYPAETPRIKHSVRCALSRFICSVRLILPFSQVLPAMDQSPHDTMRLQRCHH